MSKYFVEILQKQIDQKPLTAEENVILSEGKAFLKSIPETLKAPYLLKKSRSGIELTDNENEFLEKQLYLLRIRSDEIANERLKRK